MQLSGIRVSLGAAEDGTGPTGCGSHRGFQMHESLSRRHLQTCRGGGVVGWGERPR